MNYQQRFLKSGRVASLLLLGCAWSGAQAAEAVTNQIPNPEFRGSAGVVDDVGGTEGTINGDIPTLWRAFTRGGGEVTIEREQLPADTLFPGSPVTTALTLRVDSFAVSGDQGFDTSPTRFTLEDGRAYRGSVYMRSANADDSDQGVGVGVPVFDASGAFTGRAPGSAVVDVTSEWMLYEGPEFTESGGATAELAFRLFASGSENAIQVAIPTLEGVAQVNQAPNPTFDGMGGIPGGDVTGALPDAWRGFGVGGGSATFALEPVAADALYPGSPPTNAVRMTINSFGADQGFDNELTLFPLVAERHYVGKVYLRSAAPDMAEQTVGIALNSFNDTPAFEPPGGSGVAFVGPEWGLYSTVSARMGAETKTGSLAIRLFDESNSEHSVLIALPEVLGPDVVFENGFEGETLVVL